MATFPQRSHENLQPRASEFIWRFVNVISSPSNFIVCTMGCSWSCARGPLFLHPSPRISTPVPNAWPPPQRAGPPGPRASNIITLADVHAILARRRVPWSSRYLQVASSSTCRWAPSDAPSQQSPCGDEWRAAAERRADGVLCLGAVLGLCFGMILSFLIFVM